MFVRYGEGRANLVLAEEGWLSWRGPFYDLKRYYYLLGHFPIMT